jgi:hypothetical protein
MRALGHQKRWVAPTFLDPRLGALPDPDGFAEQSNRPHTGPSGECLIGLWSSRGAWSSQALSLIEALCLPGKLDLIDRYWVDRCMSSCWLLVACSRTLHSRREETYGSVKKGAKKFTATATPHINDRECARCQGTTDDLVAIVRVDDLRQFDRSDKSSESSENDSITFNYSVTRHCMSYCMQYQLDPAGSKFQDGVGKILSHDSSALPQRDQSPEIRIRLAFSARHVPT